MRIWSQILLSTLVLFLAGCATKPLIINTETKPKEIYAPEPVKVEYGIASYYAGRWIGRLTANGERYRAGDVTAAHKKLPFNTRVRVTNLKNGKSVIVRINNRGPYIRGRIIDLSLVSAQRTDMIQSGIVKVKLEVLKPIDLMEKSNLKVSQSLKSSSKKKASSPE